MDEQILSEWTEEGEDGRVDVRIVDDGSGPQLETRAEGGEWRHERLDGNDDWLADGLLRHLPAMLAAARAEERVRIGRELLGELVGDTGIINRVVDKIGRILTVEEEGGGP